MPGKRKDFVRERNLLASSPTMTHCLEKGIDE